MEKECTACGTPDREAFEDYDTDKMCVRCSEDWSDEVAQIQLEEEFSGGATLGA